MDSDAETGDRRNDVLSQSYIQGVERVAQQNNDVGFSFELPKEVLEKREKVWNNLFDKYVDEASDDIELNIETMEPVATAEEEEDDKEDDEEDDEEYYSKCRAPMRKLPALIQYWIDTGNPPYQLVGNDDNSGTGSSLSEGEHSRTGHSDVLRESSDKPQNDDVSPYSSVDTAAYILSNTNVTKKAETIAIVEGARKSDDSRVVENSPKKDEEIAQKTVEIVDKNISFSSTKQGVKTISNISQNSSLLPFAKENIFESELRASTMPTDNSPRLNDLFPSPARAHNQSSSQQSVKLSEVLPTFEQFDELFDEVQVMRPPKVRSSLSKVRRQPKIVISASPNDADLTASQTSQSSSLPLNGITKSHNRRKLYTGRDSPVDLAMEWHGRRKLYTERNSPVDLMPEQTSIDSIQSTGNCLHPALGPDVTNKRRISSFVSRARARRKRKRASQAAELVSQEDNTSQDSGTPIGNRTSKGDTRYTDFFESLGLTPSKKIIGETPIGKSLPKRPKKSEKRAKQDKPKEKVKLSETMESSIKETGDTSQLTEDSCILTADEKSSKIDEEAKLLRDKILMVRVERLSENSIARYRRQGKSPDRTKGLKIRTIEDDGEIVNVSQDSSSGKKRSKIAINHNIELLTTATQDSDSSTILICECNNDNNGHCSDSGNSLFTKNIPKVTKRSSSAEKVALSRSLRSKETESSAKKISEITKNLAKPMIITRTPKKAEKINNCLNKTHDNVIIEKLSKSPKRDEKINNSLNKTHDNVIIEKISKSPKRDEKINNSLNKTHDNVITEKLSNLPKLYVSIEKLSMNNSSKVADITDSLRSSKESENTSLRKNNRFTSKFLCGTKNSARTDSVMNFDGSSSAEANNKCITIGSRAINDSSDVTSKRRRLCVTSARRTLGISISSDEEEDSFVKFVKDFNSKTRTIGNEAAEKTKKINGDRLLNEMINGVEESATLKSKSPMRYRSNFGISVSSDEEDDVSTKHVTSKQRTSKVDFQKNTFNDFGCRKRKIVGNNLTEELTNGDDEVMLHNRLDESNRRRVTTIENIHENNEAKAKGKDAIRRSTRQKKLPTWGNGDECLPKDSSPSTQPKHTRKLFLNAKESNLDDENEILPHLDNRCRESKDERSLSVDIGKSGKSKNQTTLFAKPTRSGRYDKSSMGNCLNLARFQTRLDSDSDTDFESLRLSINPKYDKSSDKMQTDVVESPTKSCTEEAEKSVTVKTEIKAIRPSLRRSFRNVNERKVESSEKKLKRGNNSFDDSSDVAKKESILSKNDAKRITTLSNSRLPLINDSTTSKTSTNAKDFSRNKKNIKSKIEPREKRSPRKNSWKSDRSKNASKGSPGKESSTLEIKVNKESSTIPKKKPRKTRIIGTPMEYESDDDVNLTENNAKSIETLRSKKSIFPNGMNSESLSDNNNACDDNNSSKKRRDTSKNLFSNNIDESIEDIDLMFRPDGKSRGKQCTVVIDSLNFVTLKKHKNLKDNRQSTVRFRTKLRSDSDDENIL